MTEKENGASRPLQGIRVVEYGVFHAGPGGTAILGDLGAEVIKVESGIGDPERYWNQVGDMDMTMNNGESMMFEVSNRNKKGVYLDIKNEQGREVFNRLIGSADVFLTNLRKSTKTKLGLDYKAISAINPRIIHASVSGYGQEGPMCNLGAFDPLGMARSGMLFVTGSVEPRLIHIGVLDQATAIAVSHAIITALLARERQGVAQEVHVSLYSTALWLLYPDLMLINGMSLQPTALGDRRRHSPLRNAFCCRDGKFIIGTHHPEEKYWRPLCEAAGRLDLLTDPRFADPKGRAANCPALVDIFDQVFTEKTRDEWMEIFLSRGMMFCSIQTMEEVSGDPQALANNYMVPFDHPRLGNIMIPGYPIDFGGQEAGTTAPAPVMGQHTDEVLKEIGYSDQALADLRKNKAIR
ncbi:MAG: CoA transferase [Pseudomonadota bacterium]